MIDDYNFYHVDSDHTPSSGNTNNGQPTASNSSCASAESSNTARVNPQTALHNSLTGNNIPDKPAVLAPDSSCIGMGGSSKINTYLPVTFSNSVTVTGTTNRPPSVPGGLVAATNTSQASTDATSLCESETAQETCNHTSMIHQCDGSPQLISSSEDNSGIQPFHHDHGRDQIQQEVEVNTV